MNNVDIELLKEITGTENGEFKGAYNIRKDGQGVERQITENINIPTIGIGAGAGCDGQVLVVNDMLGMTKDFKPKFLRQYANMYTQITTAAAQYIADVKAADYPNENEQY